MEPRRDPLGGSQRDQRDFVDRFRQGPGAISEEEAASRYEQVAPNLPSNVYQQSAQEVFAQLTPEQRVQLGQALIQSARQEGQAFPDVNRDGIDDRMQDPDYLAQTATRVQQEQPGLLSRLLGGRRASPGSGAPAGSIPPGAGDMLGSPMAKGVLGGIAAAGLMNMLTSPHYYSGGLFGAPLMGGFFGGGPMFGGYGFGEGYEEGYEEGLEEGFEYDFGGGDFGGGDFSDGDFGGGDF
jgi:hypothetical protein